MISDDYLYTNIGIDSIGFYAPKYYLDIEDLAKKRNIDPDKFRIGLLLKEMRLPELDEDIISMGLKAGYYALSKGNINPKHIDAVFVGTETITYAVKSVSNIFADLLGVSTNSITQDIYNACAAGTLAIINAIALIEKGVINKALVINVDISSYNTGSPSEATQGSGATAFIITKNPRVATFSKTFGKASGNVNDFFRTANEENAQVFGKYSVDAYLNFQLLAYDDLINNIGEQIFADYYVFHAPYSKLPLKCMQQIILKRWLTNINDLIRFFRTRKQKKWISRKIDTLLQNASVVPEFIYAKLRQVGFSVARLEMVSTWIKKILKERVLPQLRVPMHFGNMYSASVWAQALFVLENHAKIGDTIYFGSYGSGATCISGLLKVQPDFESVLAKGPSINDFIDNKKRMSMNDYEMAKSGMLKPIIYLAEVEAHEQNNKRGFTIHYCDNGCIIPGVPGLNYCPKGHSGFYTRFFPLYATLISEPKQVHINDLSFLKDNLVRIAPNAKVGNTLEYEIRRVNLENAEICDAPGLLNWSPMYSPVQKIYYE